MSDDTKDILFRLRSDDATILKELFQEHYPMVCKTINRFIPDKSLTEDLAQEVFIRLWQKRKQLNITHSFVAYLRRMAINEALGQIRKNKRHQIEELNTNLHDEVQHGAEHEFLYGELKEHITLAVDTLPPRCKVVFQLSRFEELSYKEIAKKMDISVKTVENQMGKALKIMREKLKVYLVALYLFCFAFTALL